MKVADLIDVSSNAFDLTRYQRVFAEGRDRFFLLHEDNNSGFVRNDAA